MIAGVYKKRAYDDANEIKTKLEQEEEAYLKETGVEDGYFGDPDAQRTVGL